jgi:hypothetical protein
MLQLIENLLFENTDITFGFIFMAKERKQLFFLYRNRYIDKSERERE